ncbi:unnamed protein product [Closterium sp. NIES-65]|nr:unnamed protein product [Closterium sp. NIES-65]
MGTVLSESASYAVSFAPRRRRFSLTRPRRRLAFAISATHSFLVSTALYLLTATLAASVLAVRTTASDLHSPIKAPPPWDALFNESVSPWDDSWNPSGAGRGTSESRRVLRRTPTCQTTTMAGYSNMVDLSGNGYMLHWTITSRDALKLAVEERSSTGAGAGGWLMLAWARKGQPFPSDAIFGNLFGRRTVAAFTISGPGAAGAQPASFTLGRTAFRTTFNGAVMKFSRQRADGAVPVSYYGRNRLLWAFTTDSSANPTLPPFYRQVQAMPRRVVHPARSSLPAFISHPPILSTAPAQLPCPPQVHAALHWKLLTTSSAAFCLQAKPGTGAAASCKLRRLSSSPPLPLPAPALPVPPRLMLHWKLLTTTSASFCLQAKAGTAAAGGGWVSVAWSRGGAMVPADAVVGAPGGAARTFAITSYSSVDPTTRFSITGGSVNSGFNGVLLKFTRSGSAGIAPVTYLGSNRLIWAFSASGNAAIGSHGSNKGFKTVDLSCNAMCT